MSQMTNENIVSMVIHHTEDKHDHDSESEEPQEKIITYCGTALGEE